MGKLNSVSIRLRTNLHASLEGLRFLGQYLRLRANYRYRRIMPWQFGKLGLTESGGNRLIKYADALIDGVSLVSLFYGGSTN